MMLLWRFPVTAQPVEKHRLIVFTDIGNERRMILCQMVRLIVYSNQIDIEGLIASRYTYLEIGSPSQLTKQQVQTMNKKMVAHQLFKKLLLMVQIKHLEKHLI